MPGSPAHETEPHTGADRCRRLIVDRAVLSELAALVGSDSDREDCGYFLGTADGDAVHLRKVVAVRNVAARPGAFAIDDAERCRVRHLARQAGMQVVAVYHTHPSGSPELSRADRRMLAHSDVPWVVVTGSRRDGGDTLTLRLFEAGRPDGGYCPRSQSY